MDRDDEQLLRGRVYGTDHDHPSPLPHRHYANLLADPGVDQRDPAERRALVDSWLQQISQDTGLLGMEKVLEQLHGTSLEPQPRRPRRTDAL